MRDKLGWATANPNIVNAQAKISGDHEVQSMVELLQRANLLGPDGNLNAPGLGISNAPLSGPADTSADNLFEKSFAPMSESPRSIPDATSEASGNEGTQANSTASTAGSGQQTGADTSTLSPGSSQPPSNASLSPPMPKRSSLKRTYTDIAGLNLQNRLSDAMAQPYHASTVNKDAHVISPKTVPTMNLPSKPSFLGPPSQPGQSHGHHGHGRQAAAHQAIFTTDAKSPWTITAANDLACLVFGVTRAEVRKMGIMEVIREERRKWLENKLRNSDADGASQTKSPQTSSRESSPNNAASSALAMGTGVTAKLLSKPPIRQNYQSRRSKTVNGIDDNSNSKAKASAFQSANKSRGVLLCGDVIPIQKRNGDIGSASLWVKEKSGGLIWVLEEIAEDVAYLTVDEIGCTDKSTGALEAIWGLERVRRGTDIRKLLPELPKLAGTHTGALDFDKISDLRRYTARTANSISIPVTIDLLSGESTLRVSSFPHIAGILVISADTLNVTSSNSVFSAALFGIEHPEQLPITDLIPSFDKILHLLTDEDKIRLEDGLVIPEHSFRRARALLALREGRADAASIFLRPSGLPAKHRDGSDIMIDVQMRVVKSDRHDSFNNTVIPEHRGSNDSHTASEVVYALWITYSRALHAVNHGVGPVNPLISRPGSPTRRSIPGQPIQAHPVPTEESEESGSNSGDATSPIKANPSSSSTSPSLLTQQLQEATNANIFSADNTELFEHPSPDAVKAGVSTTKKKAISDFLVLEEMGQGAYGQVKLARYKKANAQKMVIKYVTKRRILVDTWTRDRRLGTVPLEIHVLDYLRRDGLMHPNIVEMADFFEDDINYYIEMVPHGLPGMDLFDYIELRVNMEEKECRKIFVQVAGAIDHLHNKARVVHRDIKDENVILDGDGAVKLVDFGSAAYIKSGPFDVFVGTIGTLLPLSYHNIKHS